MVKERLAGYCGPFSLPCQREGFTSGRMSESDAAGMQMKPGIFPVFCPYASASAVQEVAKYRATEAQDMGRVDTELVGASCMGME